MGKDDIDRTPVEDDEDEPEEDERIEEVFDYVQKHDPKETAEFINKVATQGPATIEGNLCTNKPFFSGFVCATRFA